MKTTKVSETAMRRNTSPGVRREEYAKRIRAKQADRARPDIEIIFPGLSTVTRASSHSSKWSNRFKNTQYQSGQMQRLITGH